MRRLSIPGFTPPPVRAPTEPIFIPSSSSSKKEKPSRSSEERVGNSSGTRDEIMRELEHLRSQIAANQRLDLAGGVRYSSGATWNEIETSAYESGRGFGNLVFSGNEVLSFNNSVLSGTGYGNAILPPIRRSYAGLSGLGSISFGLSSLQARRDMEASEDRRVFENIMPIQHMPVRSGFAPWYDRSPQQTISSNAPRRDSTTSNVMRGLEENRRRELDRARELENRKRELSMAAVIREENKNAKRGICATLRRMIFGT